MVAETYALRSNGSLLHPLGHMDSTGARNMTRNTKFALQQLTKKILGFRGHGMLWLRARRWRMVIRRLVSAC